MSDTDGQRSIYEALVDESENPEGEIDTHSQTDTELRRASSRQRKMTERGLEYEISLLEERFKSSVSKWRANVSKMSVCLSDENDIAIIRSNRNALEASMREVDSVFGRLTELHSSETAEAAKIQSIVTLFESLEEENQKFMCKIADRIYELQQDMAETVSRSSRRSSRSLKTQVSRASYRSQHSEAAAEAAALTAKLKYIDAEMRSRAELEKITTQRKLEMAQAKLGVLTLESFKSLDALKTEGELKTDRTREYVMTHSNASFGFEPSLEPTPKVDPERSVLNPDANQFTPVHPLPPTKVTLSNNQKENQIDSLETGMKVIGNILAPASQEIPVNENIG